MDLRASNQSRFVGSNQIEDPLLGPSPIRNVRVLTGAPIRVVDATDSEPDAESRDVLVESVEISQAVVWPRRLCGDRRTACGVGREEGAGGSDDMRDRLATFRCKSKHS